MSYTVEKHKHGVLVRGELPADDLVALSDGWKRRGLTELALGVAAALGGTLAVSTPEGAKAWEKDIAAGLDRTAADAEIKWLRGTDTGISSRTMFSVFSERLGVAALANGWGPDIPHDPADFGRCYRLLERFPAWRERLGEVAAKYPRWAPLVEAWPRMEALYREELPKGRAPKLYKLMRQLEGDR